MAQKFLVSPEWVNQQLEQFKEEEVVLFVLKF